MQGLIYFQSSSSGYIPLTQSLFNYEDELNKIRKSATNKGNGDAPVGIARNRMKKYVISMVDLAVCWKMEKLYQTNLH